MTISAHRQMPGQKTRSALHWQTPGVPRKILVTGVGAPVTFKEHDADDEYELQTILKEHPQLIPADDLGLDGDLLVVGRETTLASGSVDLVCLSRTGEIVIIEFKTGPKNPDFRHALAQVIDYGSDLWKFAGWSEFDEGVVHRYLSGNHVDAAYGGTKNLREAATQAWSIDDGAREALTLRVDRVLTTGDFHFVVAAQRFTDQMHDSAAYLNEVSRHGRYFLVELIRLDSAGQKAYAAQVVEKPTTRAGSVGPTEKATQTEFLEAIGNPAYRDAMTELFTTVTTLGFQLVWYTKGASIRMPSPDRKEPISIGWVFLDGGQWLGARHVTLGVDPATLKNHPTLDHAVKAYCDALKNVAGGTPTPGHLDAATFDASTFPGARVELFGLLENLKTAVDETGEAALHE